MTSLFDPTTVGDLDLPNRIVMAPMTRVRSDAAGLATPSMATYYAQRATAGLIVTEGVQPSPVGQSNAGTPGLHTAEQVRSWRPVTSAVHSAGGRVFAQLMHAGRVSHPDTTGHQPVAPSAVAARGASVFTPTGPQPAPVPRALATHEVPAEAESYARAARHAVAAGFDGVEVHGANGYLIGQFLAGNTNLRTDRYGGSVSGRIRFALEVVERTVDAVGAARVGLRLSPGAGVWDTVETDVSDLYTALLTELRRFDLAYVHLTQSAGDDVMLRLRRTWPGPLVVNPSVASAVVPTGREDAERALRSGADLVAFGRAFVANPDLVERLRSGHPLAVADEDTYYQGGDEGYLTYPPFRAPLSA